MEPGGAEAGQWLQQRVQVLVKSLQVQRRQWTLRRAASRDRSADRDADSDDQDVSADPEADGSEPAPAEDSGGSGAPQGDAGSPGGGGGSGGGAGAGGTSLAGRLLRQYTGPGGAAAPLRRLKQRIFGSAASLSLSGRPGDMRGPPGKVPGGDGDGAAEPAGDPAGEPAEEPAPSSPPPAEPEGEPGPGARRPSLLRGCASLPERLDASADASPQSDATGSKESVVRNVLVAPAPPPPHRRPPSIVLQQPDGAVGAVAPSEEEPAGAVPPRCPARLLQLQLHPAVGPGPGDPAAAAGADGAVPARKSPVTVQEWVDSLPVQHSRSEEEPEEPPLEDGEEALDLGLGAEAGLLYNGGPTVAVISPPQLAGAPGGADVSKSPLRRDGLAREPSVQSDVTSHGSHGSSVESYLEARKPDPEEVLLSLGFGGPVSSLDSEVSRIPRRFLQPSQVKGVAIKDFLRHQQELIENFETGFCGYRGLTGSSNSMPSVIVSKIMEKLREHERESIHSAATSEYASFATTPPSELVRRFSHHGAYHHHHSHHHRHMLKRGSAPGSSSPSLSPRNTSTLSVLNADNRRFLDSQGSKSPEVPRKRMIIGQRSFTFGRDGDLIEVESPSSLPPESRVPVPLPPLKPLVHKDSVLSSATDLSMTSVDSDSDTDDKSESYERRLQLRRTNSSMPVPEATPTPLSASYSESPSSSPVLSSLSEVDSEKLGIARFSQRPAGIGKRMSSTSLSSWESDANISPSHMCNSVFEPSITRNKCPANDIEPKEEPRFKSSHSLLSNRPLRYESIEEDVEMRIDTDSLPSSIDNDDSSSKNPDICDDSFNIGKELVVDKDRGRESPVISFSNACSTPKVPTSNDSDNNQTRRGSLKRQQKIAEEEALEILSGSLPSLPSSQIMGNVEEEESKPQHRENESLNICENGVEEGINNVPSLQQDQEIMNYIQDSCLPKVEITEKTDMEMDNVFVEEVTSLYEGTSSSPSLAFPLHNSEKDDFENPSPSRINSENSSMMGDSACVPALRGMRGDSFEMEEIGVTEDERRLVTLSRARSDSSGFLEGDLGERSPSDNSDSRDSERNKGRSEDSPVESERGPGEEEVSKPKPALRLRGSSAGSVVPAAEASAHANASASVDKRLSLPVVCVSDEQGGHLASRSSSLRSMSSDDTNTSGGSFCEAERRQRRKQRMHSAPDALTLTSSCSSVSNMFSSCSDESVIHVEPCGQQVARSIASHFYNNRDLQELLEELAERGVTLSHDFDLPSLSSHPESQVPPQRTPLQADAVRAALGAYGSQLVEGAASLQAHPDLLECGLEAQHEVQLLQDIREQIASELRRVAALLEEHPGPHAAAITRQMTMLLREQTRLCQQLEALSHGSFDSSMCMDIAPRTLSVFTTTSTPVPCCNSEQLLCAVREENRRLERLVQGHSQELAEIRLLLRELVTKQNK